MLRMKLLSHYAVTIAVVGLLGTFVIVQCDSGQEKCGATLTVSSFSENPIEPGVRTCIECVIGGSVSTTATWLIGTSPGATATTPIDSSDGEVVNGVLVILDPSTIIPGPGNANAIRVACSAGGTSLNFFILLDIFLPPVVSNVTVNETDTLLLVCIDNNVAGRASVQWENSEGEVLDRSSSFSKENVTRNYTGVYTCVLTRNDNNETLTADATVIVQYAPEVTTQQNSVLTSVGMRVTLLCNYHGVPTPSTIHWLHNGTVLDGSEPYISITTDFNSSMLGLTRIQRDNGGVYECCATNVVGIGSVIIMINIAAPPSPVSNLTVVHVDVDEVTLEWINGFDGFSPITGVQIQIRESQSGQLVDTQNLGSGGNLETTTVRDLQPSTEYTFTLHVRNAIGLSDPVSVNSRTLPLGNNMHATDVITTDEMAVTIMNTTLPNVPTSGMSVSTGAVVSAVILVIVTIAAVVIVLFGVLYYRKHRKDLSLSKLNVDLRVYSGTEGTFLENSDFDDNHKLDKTESFQVPDNTNSTIIENTVQGQGPIISEFPQATQVIEGQEISFKVVVTGYPSPMFQWYQNDKKVVEDYSIELGQDGSLHMPCSEQRHGGVYKLVATNSIGSAEKEVELKVLDENQVVPSQNIDFSPVPLTEFGSFVAKHHKNGNTGFKDLYQALDKGDNHTTKIGWSPENKKLNRFANMTVYDDNRIILKPNDTFETAKFINACYIDGYNAHKKFIATQGPLPHTLTDFWRMVVQEKIQMIVMVTNLTEGRKKKCHQYWPEFGSTDYGPINVAITDQQVLADYTTRRFQVKVANSSEKPLKVMQYHYTAWPDHGVPTYTTSVLAFHKRVMSQHKPKKGPILVHCSAGVGRTGTFIAIDSVQEQVKKENIVDIAGVVNKMRQQRMRMVQTQDQFMFIHDAILETVMCGDTQISADDLRTTLRKMEIKNEHTQKTALQEQFEVLEQVSSSANESYQCATALRHPDKNRRTDHLPSENYRVALSGEFPDYINATNVNGYKRKRAYIIAEGPMKSTTRNFWKMISDRKCGVIVMCSDFKENGEESSCQYWPASGEIKFGEFSVALLDEEKCPGYTIRKISLEVKEKPPQQVTQFHITNWDANGQCSNLQSITDVIDNASVVQRKTGNNPIVVHCHDTVSRSGMFCAIMSTIERCKTEGVVDVFQVIKALRIQKPGAILNEEQYHLVFKSVLTYLDSFDTYANFQTV